MLRKLTQASHRRTIGSNVIIKKKKKSRLSFIGVKSLFIKSTANVQNGQNAGGREYNLGYSYNQQKI